MPILLHLATVHSETDNKYNEGAIGIGGLCYGIGVLNVDSGIKIGSMFSPLHGVLETRQVRSYTRFRPPMLL